MIFFSILLFAIGLFILIKGADWLVAGASSLSLRFNIKPIVIGLTVVAFGTSAPELVVSLASVQAGSTGVAIGNIIGSNIANTLLILGSAAMIYPLYVGRNTILKEIPLSLLGVIVVVVLGLQEFFDSGRPLFLSVAIENNLEGFISRADGFILLFFFCIFLYYTINIAKNVTVQDDGIVKKPFKLSILLVLAGLVGLTVGSKFTVDNALVIARFFNVSDNLIGLTLIAVGTSLPELVTSIMAALKKNADIVLGNVIGSNIFNVFFVLGVSSIVRPIPLYSFNVVDIMVLFFTTVILFIALFTYRKHRITREEGIIMLLLYALYMGYVFIRG